jgi:hypothetical protein
VCLVIGVDAVESVEDLVHRPVGEQFAAGGDEFVEGTVLGDHGLLRGQGAGAAV